MIDKTVELEEKFNRMDERLKVVFGEIEKQLESMKSRPEYSFEDRIQEIEDLLLLLQLETTKLKEKVGEGLDFGIAPSVPDLQQRLMRIEEEMTSQTGHAPEGSNFDNRIEAIEKRLNEMRDAPQVKVNKQTEHMLKVSLEHQFSGEIRELEKRIHTLEALLEKKGRDELEQLDTDMLSDIQKILKGR